MTYRPEPVSRLRWPRPAVEHRLWYVLSGRHARRRRAVNLAIVGGCWALVALVHAVLILLVLAQIIYGPANY